MSQPRITGQLAYLNAMSSTRFFVLTLFITVCIFIVCTLGTFVYMEVVGIGNLVRSALRFPGDPIGVVGLVLEAFFSVLAIVIGVIWYFDLCQSDTIIHFHMRMICHTFCTGLIILCISRFVLIPEAIKAGSLSNTVVQFATHYHNIVLVQNNLNPILLAIERYMATVTVKTYEKKFFGRIMTIMIVISWIVSMFYYILQMYFANNRFIIALILSNVFYVVIVVVMMIIYFHLYKTNIYHFTTSMAIGTLSERYQTAENIRLLRSIIKCITIYLVGNTLVVIYYLLLVWEMVVEPDPIYLCLLDNVWNVTVALLAVCMPLPFLLTTGRFEKIKKYLKSPRRIFPSSSKRERGNTKNTVMKSVTGKDIPMTGTQGEYFNIFDQAWNIVP